MSRGARKCDRCGKLYESYLRENKKLMPHGHGGHCMNAIVALNLDESGKYYSGEPIDFCGECLTEFEQFLKAGKKD